MEFDENLKDFLFTQKDSVETFFLNGNNKKHTQCYRYIFKDIEQRNQQTENHL